MKKNLYWSLVVFLLALVSVTNAHSEEEMPAPVTKTSRAISEGFNQIPEIFVQLGHSYEICSVAFSPDGRYVLSGSEDSTLILWDIATGKEIRQFSGHTDKVYSIAFSPNGRYALSGSLDNTLKLWDVSTGKEIRQFSGHIKLVRSVAFSPDGRYALSGSADNTLKLWDIGTGKEIRQFTGHSRWVSSVSFSYDGRYVLSGSSDKTLRLWDISTGKEIRQFSGHSDNVLSVSFSPDGRYALSGSVDKTLRLWDISTGKEIRQFSGHLHIVSSVSFSSDGKYALSGSWDETLRLWDISTGKEIRQFTGHASLVTSVALSPDGRHALSDSADGTLRLWDITTGREIRQFTGHVSSVFSVTFSPDGRYALSGDWGIFRLWDISAGREIRQFTGHSRGVSSVSFSPDGKFVLSGSEDSTLRLWDISTGKEIRQFSGHTDSVGSVAFSPNGKYVLSGGGNTLSGGGDNALRLWDISTGKEIRQFTGHKGFVTSVSFSPDGKHALSGSADKTLRLWDISAGREIRQFTGHSRGVSSVSFSPDGKFVLSGSEDSTLRLWDISTGKEIRQFTGHKGFVTSVSFSPNGKYALSGGWDGTIRIWDIDSGKEIAQFISFKDRDWIVITPEGYFKTSKDGAEHLNVRLGNNVYGLDQFYDVFYRPDIVELALKGEDISSIAPLHLDDALKNPPPLVEFAGTPPAESSDKKVTVKYKITSVGGGIGDIRIFHNGKLIQSEGFYKEAVRLTPAKTSLVAFNSQTIMGQLRGIAIKGKDKLSLIVSKPKGVVYEGAITIDAVSGENEISIAAFNAPNTVQSIMKTSEFNSKLPPEDPHLYVLAVGIDKYKDGENNLKYAVKDAESIAPKLIAQTLTIFKQENIHVAILKDSEATKINILNKINDLSKAIRPTDTFIFFLAGHGILNSGLYSIITHDFDGELSDAKLINSNEIMEISKDIKSLNQLFILDTCHAGGLDNFLSGLYDARMTVLARNMGLHMYASASSTEEALDGYKGNGMFTYTLLDGLHNNKAADTNNDTGVSIEELGIYAKDSTVKISQEIGHKQNPLIINFGKDSFIYKIR